MKDIVAIFPGFVCCFRGNICSRGEFLVYWNQECIDSGRYQKMRHIISDYLPRYGDGWDCDGWFGMEFGWSIKSINLIDFVNITLKLRQEFT